MKNNRLKCVVLTIAFFILTIIVAASSVPAQKMRAAPELCVAGFCLGESEEAAKTKLQDFSPRYDNERRQPKYFFYNEYGNQVLAITAHSKERRFLIVGVEAFAVDESYTTKHYQMKQIAAFTTESGFFIGLRPSATSMIFGVPNSSGPKEVIRKKGQPDSDDKPEKFRILRYKTGNLKESEAPAAKAKNIDFGAYTAEYRFYKNNLRHLIIAVDANL